MALGHAICHYRLQPETASARPHGLLFWAPGLPSCVCSHFGSGQGGKGHGFCMYSLGFTQSFVSGTSQGPVVLCSCGGPRAQGSRAGPLVLTVSASPHHFSEAEPSWEQPSQSDTGAKAGA
ncbi:Hypothetical predicted protein [Marmota monax]|uniref:Uncharacterized protein n=1 Tax=Marmota monax TaxID=9995 RepID=A0A5E4BLG4_MARMO|nr:Hypothetical predicted protein [Marmota monax]